ncbi:MAG: serine/threonine protein kinase [Phycisphaerales bacterium]|nr:serine/threonine protein kinase [Phycisphaerales bacterium]
MSDIETIFETARQLDPELRGAYLDRACGSNQELRAEVDRLLAADDHLGAFLESDVFDPDATLPDLPPSAAQTSSQPAEAAGDQMGNYKLLQQIGEGGFGTVWMAEQREPVRRRVALKIIKLGMDTKQVIARFEAERQALAMMDHPNIAKVFDAGMTETGRPYFVMEYIKGIPILQYCDHEKVDTRGRLDLFTKVCHAIQHAHQKGIIHRDIKPGNVLVTMHDGVPVPKVIDFGIAKATNAELTDKTLFTQHRQMIGTPVYMSPEQAEMSGLDIDTRSDIYSLGVLLYELLTGTTPFDHRELLDRGFGEMMRIIREETPHKPSTRLSSLGETASRTAEQRHTDIRRLGLILRGDLDWIVMKCLEKDRTRRYDTANGLAADIQRHLSNEPVSAGPPSASYRLRKFVRRNRAGVLAALAVGSTLLLGLAGTTGGMYWAVQEKDRADLAAEQALEAQAVAQTRSEELQQVVEFQSAQLSGIDVAQMGINMRQDLLENARLVGERLQENTPQIEERIAAVDQSLLGVDFTGWAQSTLETNVFLPAIDAIQEQFGQQPEVRADLFTSLSETLHDIGLLDLAEKAILESIETRTKQLGESDPQTIDANMRYGMILTDLGQLDRAEQLFQNTLANAIDSQGEDSRSAIDVRYHYATLQFAQTRYQEAADMYASTLEWYRTHLGPLDGNTLGAMSSLAASYNYTDRQVEAEQLYSKAIDGMTELYGRFDQRTIRALNNLAGLYRSMDDLPRAAEIFTEALELSRTTLGEDHNVTLMLKDNLGGVRYNQLDFDGAWQLTNEALEGRKRVLGPLHDATLRSYYNLALVNKDMKRFDASISLLQQALPGFERVYGEFHGYTITVRKELSNLLFQEKRFNEVETLFLNEYALFDHVPDAPLDRKRSLTNNMAVLYRHWDQAQPDRGHAEKAAEWKARFEAMDPEPQADP